MAAVSTRRAMKRRHAAARRWPARDRSRWSSELLDDPGLSETAFRVAFTLAPLFSQLGQVRPIEAAIATKLGMTVDAVHSALNELVDREHLELVHADGQHDRQFEALLS